MKEIEIQQSFLCPFNMQGYRRDKNCCSLLMVRKGKRTTYSVSCDDPETFPPNCPLFENDYLIKRRTENESGTN